MMNFRQRLGWVGVAVFLLLSAAASYGVFELLGPERVQRDGVGVVSAHLPALPPWAWPALFLAPYLQLFLFLFSCTRADPRAVGYCLLPVCLFLLCRRRRRAPKAANHRAGLLLHM